MFEGTEMKETIVTNLLFVIRYLNGWVLVSDWNGDILNSHVFVKISIATEYGCFDRQWFNINDTDAGGDEEAKVVKIVNGSNPPPTFMN